MQSQDLPSFDLLVFGGTAPGLVAGVRAARQGLNVALVSPTQHLGGSLPSLGAFETHYRGNRAPLLQEIIDAVRTYYENRYGTNSDAYHACAGGRMITFEPHVIEGILDRLVAAEKSLRVWRGFAPVDVATTGAVLQVVSFRDEQSGQTLRLAAAAFIEASYEGDLMALARVRYVVGREARAEFGEPRAGRVFTQWLTGEYPREAAEGRLNLVTAGATTSDPLPGSTGEGDDNIQSYSYRLCVTDDPANWRLLTSPPAGYDRARYAPILLPTKEKEKLRLPFHHRFLIYSLREMVERDHVFHGHALPNRKRSWNATNFTGAGKNYAEADAASRHDIACLHLEHALGLMWFLQNDAEVPADLRAKAREWGLARDEFAENGNIPPQLYVREARRLVGRTTFTEHDALLVPSSERAPAHADSIAITEFSLDSLACTAERLPGGESLCDGQLFQMDVSRPGQVPFGVLLPRELDNLLVVTTLSATHVGWGTIRQTPTLMHIAESAAWAAVLAARESVFPANVNITKLQRLLVERRVMISFFNEFDMAVRESWVPAVQFCGTQGFFTSYDARPTEPLDAGLAEKWALRAGIDAGQLAGLTRGAACQVFWESLLFDRE